MAALARSGVRPSGDGKLKPHAKAFCRTAPSRANLKECSSEDGKRFRCSFPLRIVLEFQAARERSILDLADVDTADLSHHRRSLWIRGIGRNDTSVKIHILQVWFSPFANLPFSKHPIPSTSPSPSQPSISVMHSENGNVPSVKYKAACANVRKVLCGHEHDTFSMLKQCIGRWQMMESHSRHIKRCEDPVQRNELRQLTMQQWQQFLSCHHQ